MLVFARRRPSGADLDVSGEDAEVRRLVAGLLDGAEAGLGLERQSRERALIGVVLLRECSDDSHCEVPFDVVKPLHAASMATVTAPRLCRSAGVSWGGGSPGLQLAQRRESRGHPTSGL